MTEDKIASAEDRQGPAPPLPIRIIARTLSWLIARAPFLWPVLRRPSQRFWEKAAAGWDKRIRPDSAEHLAPLAAACDRLGRDPDRVLELGTGTGAGALMLARRFPSAEIWAVDLADAMVDQAKRKTPEDLSSRLHFAAADAAALPHESDFFDLVCQINLPLYANEIARVLAPGGHVVIASSRGPGTPYYTPDRVLRRRFEARGFETLEGGRAGQGTYFFARRRK